MNLEEQRLKRRELSENYYKAVKWVNNADAVLIALFMGLGGAGVGLLSTIIAASVVVVLESVSSFKKFQEMKNDIKTKTREQIRH